MVLGLFLVYGLLEALGMLGSEPRVWAWSIPPASWSLGPRGLVGSPLAVHMVLSINVGSFSVGLFTTPGIWGLYYGA